MVMSGDALVPNVSLKGTGRPPFDDRQMALLAGMYEGTRFQAMISEGFNLRKTVAEQADLMAKGGATAEMQAANRNALTAKGFELEARRMAGLMKDRFNIGFIDVGGWDTHVNQGNAQGQLANLLASLGQGLAGFADQMGPAWNQTVVFVLSEFGRTFRENGTRGTDHGHGSAHWVLGGGGVWRTVRGRSGRGEAGHPQSESRFSRAHRISQPAWWSVPTHVWSGQHTNRARVSRRDTARTGAGVTDGAVGYPQRASRFNFSTSVVRFRFSSRAA